MADRFRHDTLAQRVSFSTGRGPGDLRDALDRTGASNPLWIVDPRQREWAAPAINAAGSAGVISDIAIHVPLALVDRVAAMAREVAADLLVAIGGGSAIGLAKGVALRTDLAIVAVPSTYAGSEVTPIWGITADGFKKTGRDPRVLPVEVIYDIELTSRLPLSLTVESSLNALAHAIDSLWAPSADPVNAAHATEAIRRLTRGLRAIVDEDTVSNRYELSIGGHLGARAFASAGSGIHHKICHVLGGGLDLPHAAVHAIVLPHVIAFNLPAAPEAAERLRSILSPTPLRELSELYDYIGAPRNLSGLGVELDAVLALVPAMMTEIPKSNPRRIVKSSIEALVTDAWCGVPFGVTD